MAVGEESLPSASAIESSHEGDAVYIMRRREGQTGRMVELYM